MSLRPDHDAAALRNLMNRFAAVTTGPTRQELTESRAAVAAAEKIIAEGVRVFHGQQFVFPEDGQFGYSVDGGDGKFTILDHETGEVRDIPTDRLPVPDNPSQTDLDRLVDQYDQERYDSGASVPDWIKKSRSVTEAGLKFQPDGQGGMKQKPGAFKSDPKDRYRAYREKRVVDRMAKGIPRRDAQQFDDPIQSSVAEAGLKGLSKELDQYGNPVNLAQVSRAARAARAAREQAVRQANIRLRSLVKDVAQDKFNARTIFSQSRPGGRVTVTFALDSTPNYTVDAELNRAVGEEMARLGYDYRLTDGGWLSVKVPTPAVSEGSKKQMRWGYHIVVQQTGNRAPDTPQFKTRSEAVQYLRTIPVERRRELEVDEFQMREGIAEGVNEKQIKRDLDSGMSMDAVIGKHANKKTTNTDEIRRVIQRHAQEKRKKKVEEQRIAEGSALAELDTSTLQSYLDKGRQDVAKRDAEIEKIGSDRDYFRSRPAKQKRTDAMNTLRDKQNLRKDGLSMAHHKLHKRSKKGLWTDPNLPRAAKTGVTEAQTVGNIKFDNGVITQGGKKIGTAMQGLQHGYHPSIELTLNNGFNKWYEFDTENLMQTMANDINASLGSNTAVKKPGARPGIRPNIKRESPGVAEGLDPETYRSIARAIEGYKAQNGGDAPAGEALFDLADDYNTDVDTVLDIINGKIKFNSIAEGSDTPGAYDKWDPKHPDFVKNYRKFQAQNPGATLKDYVADLKKGIKEGSQPTEKVGSVIKRVLGQNLVWEPGYSKLYKNTRRSRTQRVDGYTMKGVQVRANTGNHLSADNGDQLAVDLKNAVVQAGYPVHGDVLIFSDEIVFQTRTPITTTAETGVAEAATDYFKRRKDREDRVAGVRPPQQRQPRQTDYDKKRQTQQQQDMAEGLNEAARMDDVELTASQFHAAISRIMQGLVNEYQSEVQASTSTPSAPDTSKFRATVGGMIEYATRLAVHGGYYGSSKQYIDFIKIGAGIPRQVTKDLMRDFAAHMEEQFDITVTPGVSIATEDGYVFSFQVEEGGTNWNGFGFTARKVETEGVTEAGRKQPRQTDYDKKRQTQQQQDMAEGLDQARVSPETLRVVQQLRKQLSRRTSLQAKKTMLVIKSDQLGPQDRKLIQDTLTQAGITFKIKDNEVQSVRGGSWKNTLVGIPYDQTGVAEAAGMYNDKELNEGLSHKIKKIIKAYKNLFLKISYNENGKKIMSGPKAHKEASRQLGVDPDDMEEYLRLEYYDFFDTVNKEWEKQKGNRKERYSNEIYGKVDADPTKSWWDLHQADAARRADRTKIKEAGRKQPGRPKFTLYPSYHAWRLELMRRGDDNIDHLDNDYVDNYRVLFAVDRNRRVVGMYYRTAETGTFVPPGQGFSDMIYYASADPHWPYSDDDGKEDLR